MNNEFISLTEEEYIVMLGKDTFTVSRLKELIAFQLDDHISNYGNFFNLKFYPSKDDDCCFGMENIRLLFPGEGIEGYLLKLGSKEWIAGKIKIQVDLSFDPESMNRVFSFEIHFSPHQPLIMIPLNHQEELEEEFHPANSINCQFVH